MEMTVCFLLLLLCSLSTAQLQSHDDNHITDPGEQTERQRRESDDASNQEQTSPPDIYAALKELNATVAEQKVELSHLQKKNEEQEAKLESQRAEVERQKVEVEELKQILEAQAAELVSMKSRTNVTEHQVEALRRDGKVKQVAFSASLSDTGFVTVGPFSTHTNLVFKHVFLNIGKAYSPHTGLFTAPVRGVYHFGVHNAAIGHADFGSIVVLVKNGENVFSSYEYQTNGYGTSANGVILHLKIGDVVFLRLWANTRITDDEFHHSTFSGHLLFTM